MLKSSFLRIVQISLAAHLVLVLGTAHPWPARADSPSPSFDPRDCVCNTGMRWAPIDIFTAKRVLHEEGYHQHEVVEILTHGLVQRQVVGQPIAGLRILQGYDGIAEAALIYAGQTDGDFYVIAIPSLNIDEVFLRTMNAQNPLPQNIDEGCRTEFGVRQLIRFMEALAANEGTCHKLATKYLGLPKPPPEGVDNAFQDCAGGRVETSWLVLVVVALGIVTVRRSRYRTTARGDKV